MSLSHDSLVDCSCFPGQILPRWRLSHLTGERSGSLSGTNYVVTGNIYILPHDTLSIAPGSFIRFEPFTGIVVRGTLLCSGTAREPVLLTSVRDSLEGKPPRPFDWNGVFGVS